MDLSGRRVMITGASGALGQGLVTAFAQVGADVVAITRSPADQPAPGVRYETADLASESSIAELFERVEAPWAVVNTVGGFAPKRPLAELDVDELLQQQTLNLTTAAIVNKYALRAMANTGEGRIVHTASQAATATATAGFAYSVSKAGVLHLVKMAAREVAKTGIRVNAVSPSLIDTAANRAAMPGADHGSWPKVAEIAGAYLFLAAPESRLVNGAVLPV